MPEFRLMWSGKIKILTGVISVKLDKKIRLSG